MTDHDILQEAINRYGEDSQIEKWVDIDGYEGSYQVSNLGRVKGLTRIVDRSSGFPQTIHGRIMTPVANPRDRYYGVRLMSGGKGKMHKIHRIVAKYFIPNPLNLDAVNHINGDRQDNRIENLEWVTNRENSCHGRLLRNHSSSFTGVHFNNTHNRWVAKIMVDKKSIHIGEFRIEKDAHEAYKNKSIELGIVNKYV